MGGNDGVDPDSCRNVTIENVYIDTGDDAISVKAVGPEPCTDVHIRNVTLISRNFAVGEHTSGGISNVLFEDSRIGDDHGSSAWGIKFKCPGTGIVEDITLRRLQLGRIVAKSYYNGSGGFALQMAGDGMRNITITDIHATSVVTPGSLAGSAASPLVGLTLGNMTLHCEGPGPCRRFGCRYVESSSFAGLAAELRPKCHTDDELAARQLSLRVAALLAVVPPALAPPQPPKPSPDATRAAVGARWQARHHAVGTAPPPPAPVGGETALSPPTAAKKRVEVKEEGLQRAASELKGHEV